MLNPLRSQLLTTGTALVVCGAALTAHPVTGPSLPAVVAAPVAAVALAGFDSPLGELLLTVGQVGNDLLNPDPLDVIGDYSWMPYQGLAAEFIYTALPIVSQLGFNGLTYLTGSLDALVGTTASAAYTLTEAVWNLPGQVITAIGQVAGGDVAAALTTLVDATLVPLRDAGTVALEAGAAVFGGVLTSITNLIAAAPPIVSGLLGTVIGSLQAVAGSVVAIATNTVTALASLDIEGAWNAVVDGLLGPVGSDGLVTSSLPGTLTAVTIGAGLGPLGYPNGYALPSLRMWGEQSSLQIANALGATYPLPAAATAPTAPARAAAALGAPDTPAPARHAARTEAEGTVPQAVSARSAKRTAPAGDESGSGRSRAARR